MRFWYPFLTLVLCVECYYGGTQSKGSVNKLGRESLLKFFKLNSDLESPGQYNTSRNQTTNTSAKAESIFSSSWICRHNSTGITRYKKCLKRQKNNAVKKSFRPHDYDDDEDYDDPGSDYEETPEDEEFPQDDLPGSYRSYNDLPPRPRDSEGLYGGPSERLRDYEAEEEDSEARRRYEFEDEPPNRPGYEDELDHEDDEDDEDDERDGWDWEPPRRHHGGKRWKSHQDPDDDDEYEPSYHPRYQHHPRHAHYHRQYFTHPSNVRASYRTFDQSVPSWRSPYTQIYQAFYPTSAPYTSHPARLATFRSGQASWQPPYLRMNTRHLLNAVGPSVINPYLQNTFTYPHRETNSFFIPPRRVSSTPYLEATARNLVSFTRTIPDIAATLPRLSDSVYHYPRVIPGVASRSRHFRGHLSGPFLRHSEFPDAVLNRIRELNLH